MNIQATEQVLEAASLKIDEFKTKATNMRTEEGKGLCEAWVYLYKAGMKALKKLAGNEGKGIKEIKPSHYAQGEFELFDMMEAVYPIEQVVGFYKLNAIKYLTRFEQKNGIEDLYKALTYIKRLIEFKKNGVRVKKVG